MLEDTLQQLLALGSDEESWDETETTEESEPQRAFLAVHTSRQLFQAHILLLDNTIVSLQSDAEAYRLVRLHFHALSRWHEQHTGWRIQRGPSFFRLERHLYMPASLFLDEKLKRPRDFVCLTWILWFAEQRHLAGGGRNQQFLLSQLAEALQQQSQQAPGIPLDFRNIQDRYSMKRALDYLTQLGGLQALEGELDRWRAGDAEGEVLYEFTPISHSLIEALSEQRVASMAKQVSAKQGYATEHIMSSLTTDLPPLARAWRTLLLGPALLRYEDVEAFAALVAHAEQVSQDLAQSFGWYLELNSDYACVVRGGTLSAGAGPSLALNSALDQIILLLCTTFRKLVEESRWSPDSYGCLHTTSFEIEGLFSHLRQRYGSYWGATVKESKGFDLLADIYARMRMFGLLRGPDAEGHILILPTAARYSVSYSQGPQATEASPTAPGNEQRTGAARRTRTTSTSSIRGKRTPTPGATPQLALDWDTAENHENTRGNKE